MEILVSTVHSIRLLNYVFILVHVTSPENDTTIFLLPLILYMYILAVLVRW